MAKYIEEQEILWRMNNTLDEQDTYLPIHFKEMVIDECNPSDVVERSEIDKAIEEMANLEKSYTNMITDEKTLVNECYKQYEAIVGTCLEILKRNIGE